MRKLKKRFFLEEFCFVNKEKFKFNNIKKRVRKVKILEVKRINSE